MKQHYIRDIFVFANTTAGKFVAVLVAVLMVLSLSPLALAVDDMVDEATSQDAAESVAQGQGDTSSSGQDEGAGNTDGAGGAGDEAGMGDVGSVGDATPAGGVTPSGDATPSGDEGATNEADTGTGNEAGADDITIDGDIDIDTAIADAITQDTPAIEEDVPSGAVDEVSVFFYSENCTIVLNGANVSGSVNMPQFKDFSFTVVPNSGYTVSQVTAGAGGPIAPGIIDSENDIYTIPGTMVTSNLNVSAEAIPDDDAIVDDPTPTTVCDDSTIVAPGTYEAPVITLQDMTRVYTGVAQPEYGYELEFSAEGLQDGDELIISGFEGAGKDAGLYQLQVTDYWIMRDVEYDETIPEECQNLNPDVTAEYQPIDLSTVTATLTIEKAPALHLVTPSASKVYDGTPLTYAGEGGAYDYSDVGWMLEEGIIGNYDGPPVLFELHDFFEGNHFAMTGSQTEIGRSYNTAILRDDIDASIRKNYEDVIYHYGTLIVRAPEGVVTIQAPSGSKVYDGTPLKVSASDIFVDGLPEGFTVQASLLNDTLTNAGRTAVRIDENSLVILNQEGDDVTALYTDKLVFAPGEIYIEPVSIYAPTPGTTGNGGTGTGGAGNGGTGTGGAGTGTTTQAAGLNSVDGAAAGAAGNAGADTGINPAVEAVATAMQNVEQMARGEETTGLIAPATEETLGDEETPLGVFDEPIDCWVHWYALLGLLVTIIYGAVVMFFRRAYAYELESREANILGAPVGMAQPQVPAGTNGRAGREA